MHAAMERAVERARKDKHPTLLEVRTYRFMATRCPIRSTDTIALGRKSRTSGSVTDRGVVHRLIEDGLTDQAP